MKKILFLLVCTVSGTVVFGQTVQSNARLQPATTTPVEAKEQPVVMPDSVTTVSSGRFAKPVVQPYKPEPTNAQPEEKANTTARKRE